MPDKGYIHIYTGDGKGKTTAAVGLAVRAAGHGLSVYIGQFMKGQFYGELESLKTIPGIVLRQYGMPECITRDGVNQAHRESAAKGIREFRRIMEEDRFAVMIMDEICVAVWFGLIPEFEVVDLMKAKPARIELILTGRKASRNLIEHADLVTDMQEVKHYYRTYGLTARKGIEN